MADADIVGVDQVRAMLGLDFARKGPDLVTWLRGWAQRLEAEHPDHDTGYIVGALEQAADLIDQALRDTPCEHDWAAEITTINDMTLMRRVYLCNRCSQTIEEPT